MEELEEGQLTDVAEGQEEDTRRLLGRTQGAKRAQGEQRPAPLFGGDRGTEPEVAGDAEQRDERQVNRLDRRSEGQGLWLVRRPQGREEAHPDLR